MESRSSGYKTRVATWLLVLGLCVPGLLPPQGVWATHEADHRFSVEGFVCDLRGNPSTKTEVVVKNTRVNVGQTVETDERGYYKVTLHLHNDNLGDPIVVKAQREEQRTTVQFDPNDLESERKARLDFGTGCQQAAPDEVPVWVYYTVGGLGLVGVAVMVARLARKSPQVGRKQKKHRK